MTTLITRADVDAAAARIAGRVRRTPVTEADPGTFGATRLYLKCEFMQHTGSFKARGAFNRLLAALGNGEMPPEGVIAASGGNAGMAVAYAASQLGVPAVVYVPATAPAVKVAKLHKLGATVRQVGAEYAEAYEEATKAAADTGALFCHAYDSPEICAGQGTLARELTEQVGGELDTIILVVGGGGLLAGTLGALDGRAKVVAIEPEGIPTLHSALAASAPVDIAVDSIAADSLGARRIGDIAFAMAQKHPVESLLVSDEAIVAARRLLWDHRRIVVEHGTAAALAALMTGAYVPAEGERVAILLCGANTDPADLV